MSQTTTQTIQKDLDPWDGMAYASIDRLAPFFVTSLTGRSYARYAASEAIAGYQPQSRADYANIGRIIALSLLVMAIGAKAAAADVPLELQLKIVSRLQAISRAADATEKLMTSRRNQAWADGSHKRPDGLIGRPPGDEPPYPPLPASDPASGQYAAMPEVTAAARGPVPVSKARVTDAKMPVETTGLQAHLKVQGAPATSGQTEPAAKVVAAKPPAHQTTTAQPNAVGATLLPRHDTFEAFVRDALAATGGIPPEVEDLLREFGLPPLGVPAATSPGPRVKTSVPAA